MTLSPTFLSFPHWVRSYVTATPPALSASPPVLWICFYFIFHTVLIVCTFDFEMVFLKSPISSDDLRQISSALPSISVENNK